MSDTAPEQTGPTSDSSPEQAGPTSDGSPEQPGPISDGSPESIEPTSDYNPMPSGPFDSHAVTPELSKCTSDDHLGPSEYIFDDHLGQSKCPSNGHPVASEAISDDNFKSPEITSDDRSAPSELTYDDQFEPPGPISDDRPAPSEPTSHDQSETPEPISDDHPESSEVSFDERCGPSEVISVYHPETSKNTSDNPPGSSEANSDYNPMPSEPSAVTPDLSKYASDDHLGQSKCPNDHPVAFEAISDDNSKSSELISNDRSAPSELTHYDQSETPKPISDDHPGSSEVSFDERSGQSEVIFDYHPVISKNTSDGPPGSSEATSDSPLGPTEPTTGDRPALSETISNEQTGPSEPAADHTGLSNPTSDYHPMTSKHTLDDHSESIPDYHLTSSKGSDYDPGSSERSDNHLVASGPNSGPSGFTSDDHPVQSMASVDDHQQSPISHHPEDPSEASDGHTEMTGEGNQPPYICICPTFPPNIGEPPPGLNRPEPGPNFPNLDEMEKIKGYENVGFEEVIIQPPATPGWKDQSEADRQSFATCVTLTEADIRNALNAAVSDKHIGKKFVNQLNIKDIETRNTFYYTLQTFKEKRESAWHYDPYEEQKIDASTNGMAPAPWDIPAQPTEDYEDRCVQIEVPHTAFVKPCHTCFSEGLVRCYDCLGKAKKDCIWCDGTGTKLGESCKSCSGEGNGWCMCCGAQGEIRCRTCKMMKKVKGYIQLTVTWKHHHDGALDTWCLPPEKMYSYCSSDSPVFEEERPRVWPLSNSGDTKIDDASRELVIRHDHGCSNERILKQKHSLFIIPVTRVKYEWKGAEDEFCIYGKNREVYFKKSPQNSRCSIL